MKDENNIKYYEERLARQIAKRDKEIRIAGFASKRSSDRVAKTRNLLELEKKKYER
jgi:hypothetical protein